MHAAHRFCRSFGLFALTLAAACGDSSAADDAVAEGEAASSRGLQAGTITLPHDIVPTIDGRTNDSLTGRDTRLVVEDDAIFATDAPPGGANVEVVAYDLDKAGARRTVCAIPYEQGLVPTHRVMAADASSVFVMFAADEVSPAGRRLAQSKAALWSCPKAGGEPVKILEHEHVAIHLFPARTGDALLVEVNHDFFLTKKRPGQRITNGDFRGRLPSGYGNLESFQQSGDHLLLTSWQAGSPGHAVVEVPIANALTARPVVLFKGVNLDSRGRFAQPLITTRGASRDLLVATWKDDPLTPWFTARQNGTVREWQMSTPAATGTLAEGAACWWYGSRILCQNPDGSPAFVLDPHGEGSVVFQSPSGTTVAWTDFLPSDGSKVTWRRRAPRP